MKERGGAGYGDASIYGLGAWAGARPVLWIRVGAAAAAVGYAVTLTFHFFSGVATLGHEETEILTLVLSAGAFLIAGRWPALAAGLTIGAVSLDLVVSTWLVEDSQYVGAIILPI